MECREEEDELLLMLRAGELKGGIVDFDNWLRNLIKHADLTDEQLNIYEKVRDRLREEIGEMSMMIF
jgi:hypothetical protein